MVWSFAFIFIAELLFKKAVDHEHAQQLSALELYKGTAAYEEPLRTKFRQRALQFHRFILVKRR